MTTTNVHGPMLEVQGVTVPKLGFGTWEITGEAATEAVRHALEIGYRHLDTARVYGNEVEVGRGIAASGVPREDVFLTTKVFPSEFRPEKLRAAAEDSLRNLGVDRVDLLLLHWPSRRHDLEETLGALDAVREDGLTRLIGVSNFPAGMLREARAIAPVANDQVEFHPFLGQDRLLAEADGDCFITAYSPLARGKVNADPVLREIGAAHGKSPGQIALRWLLDLDHVAVIPKSATAARRQENFDVLDFELGDEERARIDALPKDRRELDPEGWAPDWDQ